MLKEKTGREKRQVERIVSPLIIHRRKKDIMRVIETLKYIQRTSNTHHIDECLWRVRSIIDKKYNVSYTNGIVTVEKDGNLIVTILIAG